MNQKTKRETDQGKIQQGQIEHQVVNARDVLDDPKKRGCVLEPEKAGHEVSN